MTEMQAVSATVASVAGGIIFADLAFAGLVVAGLIVLPFAWPVALGLLGGIAVIAIIVGIAALVIYCSQPANPVDLVEEVNDSSPSFAIHSPSEEPVFCHQIDSANEKIRNCLSENRPLTVNDCFLVQKAYEKIIIKERIYTGSDFLIEYYCRHAQEISGKSSIYEAWLLLSGNYEKFKKFSFSNQEIKILQRAIECVGRYPEDCYHGFFVDRIRLFADSLLREQSAIIQPLQILMICKVYEILEGSRVGDLWVNDQQGLDEWKKEVAANLCALKIKRDESVETLEDRAFVVIQAHALVKRTQIGAPLTDEERQFVYKAYEIINDSEIQIVGPGIQGIIKEYILEVEPLREEHIIYRAHQILLDVKSGIKTVGSLTEEENKIIREAEKYIVRERFKILPAALEVQEMIKNVMITPDQLRALQFIVTYMQKARESSRARELLETEEGKFFVEIYKKLKNIP
ncbi:MAG TPA: hypothetical protein DCE71_03885, partial [Parachlamydiales bacterium]|nr:hypothetical protein [Parachlamydiales bacterium]